MQRKRKVCLMCRKKFSIELLSEEAEILDLAEKDFKTGVINML